MACVNVIAADTDEEAERLATSFYMLALGLIRNQRKPLAPPVVSMEGQWTEYEKAAMEQLMRYRFIGSQKTIERDLQLFLDATAVDEIMIATHVYDLDAKKRSLEIVASLFRKS
jgi:alkanesulfonate monooxygenase SsuD/methylene tetrahydromethanopterin reductase-like flavin-dependent oxidoreductase (luciferase family)